MEWPSGHPANSAIRSKPAFWYRPGAWKSWVETHIRSEPRAAASAIKAPSNFLPWPRASIGLVDPHQLELGDAGPGIAGGDPDGASFVIPQSKGEGTVVVTTGQPPVVVIETLLDDMKLGCRKIMLGLQARGHQIPPYQS